MCNLMQHSFTWYTAYIQWTGKDRGVEMIINIRGQAVFLVQLVHFERQLFVVVHSLDPVPSIVADRVVTGESLFYI